MVHEVKEFKAKDDEDGTAPRVRAYKVEEPHEIATIGGVRQVADGYVIERDRPELKDHVSVEDFERGYAQVDDNEPLTTRSQFTTTVSPTGSEATDYDPGEHTISEVQQYLREHPDQRDTVLQRERDGASRDEVLNGQ